MVDMLPAGRDAWAGRGLVWPGAHSTAIRPGGKWLHDVVPLRRGSWAEGTQEREKANNRARAVQMRIRVARTTGNPGLSRSNWKRG